MRKTFEFVKVGGVWFYWWPDFDGDPGELAMVGGADNLLDSLDDRFVRLQMVDPSVAKITLSKIEEDESGELLLFYIKEHKEDIIEYFLNHQKDLGGCMGFAGAACYLDYRELTMQDYEWFFEKLRQAGIKIIFDIGMS